MKKTLVQEIENLRHNRIESLKGLLLSRRNSIEDEIVETIESVTEGIVKAEKIDHLTVKVSTENESRTFLLLDENELEGNINPNDIRGLAEYLVNAVTYEYSREFLRDMLRD